MRHRTVVAIAHRLSTVQNFDRIVLLQGGRIMEEGPPGRLLHLGGAFSEMVRKQMAPMEPAVSPRDGGRAVFSQ
jgi:ATP-binding cassette subfamily B protein